MKKLVIQSVLYLFLGSRLFAQDAAGFHIPLIGEMAPEFTAQSTQGKIHFPDDYPMKWKILFSHPADFTPVCSTEILQMALMEDEFTRLNAKIFVVSTDGIQSHKDWVRSLESIDYPGKNPIRITFPLISDTNYSISKKYGMLHSYTSTTRDIRGVFIIDPNDRICAVFFYPHNIGRNLEEIKRTLIALQTSDKYNVLTPVNWSPGGKVLEKEPVQHKGAPEPEKKKSNGSPVYPWYMNFITIP
jgi:peroxiredoxin 2/4